MPTDTANNDMTTGEVAAAFGVDPRTVCNWIDRGILKAYMIPSGTKTQHRRVVRSDAIDFATANGIPVPKVFQVNAGGV